MPGSHLSTILIVDDSPENISVLSDLLHPDYRVRAATHGEKALRIAAESPHPDLILLDVMMPGMDGHEVFARLRGDAATRDIPIVFVTAMDSVEAELRGLALGAADYLTKPIAPAIVLARVRTQIELKRARDRLAGQNAWLEAEIGQRMGDNLLVQEVSIHALARLAETRDPETGNHLRRTKSYVRGLAQRLGGHPRFAGVLDAPTVDLLARSAPLHDIGKVGIPDHILLKPGKLTPEEFAIMKTHARLGSEALAQAERDAEKTVDFLVLAKEIAHWHHERWDGGGYPDGLAGDAIPVSARLMAVADVFDALTSPRVYKPPMPYAQARDIIAAGRGRQFDPDMADAFLADFDEFVAIAEQHRDSA